MQKGGPKLGTPREKLGALKQGCGTCRPVNHYQESGKLCQEDVIGRPSEGVEAKEEQRKRRKRRGENGESFGYSKTEHAEDKNPQLRKKQRRLQRGPLSMSFGKKRISCTFLADAVTKAVRFFFFLCV